MGRLHRRRNALLAPVGPGPVYTGASIRGIAVIHTKVFKSGNSAAVRLPKELGLDAGTEFTIREEEGRLVLERVGAPPKKIDLTGIYGSCPGLKAIEPEDRLFEERGLDWERTA